MAKKTKKQAFTIVELVIVIAVIAILAAILIPTYSNLVKKANEATALVDAKNLITEMLADILSGDKDAADLIVFSKKGDHVFLYGYDASRGMVLSYKEMPLKDFDKNITVSDGHEFYNMAASFCKKMIGTDIKEVSVPENDWRDPKVLNIGTADIKCTVEELGFDKNTMAVFANYEILDGFAKKSSAGDDPVHTHDWGDPTYNWTDDYSKCTAKRVCKVASCIENETETVDSTLIISQKQSCVNDEMTKYTADFENSAFTTQTKEVKTKGKLGHKYKYEKLNDTHHKVTCEICDYNENEAHDGATSCSKCGWAKAEVTISLNKTSLTLKFGDTETLIATVTPAGTAVTWETSDSSVATVDGNGTVKAVSNGTAIITAKAGDKAAECTVTVTEKWEIKDGLLYHNDEKYTGKNPSDVGEKGLYYVDGALASGDVDGYKFRNGMLVVEASDTLNDSGSYYRIDHKFSKTSITTSYLTDRIILTTNSYVFVNPGNQSYVRQYISIDFSGYSVANAKAYIPALKAGLDATPWTNETVNNYILEVKNTTGNDFDSDASAYPFYIQGRDYDDFKKLSIDGFTYGEYLKLKYGNNVIVTGASTAKEAYFKRGETGEKMSAYAYRNDSAGMGLVIGSDGSVYGYDWSESSASYSGYTIISSNKVTNNLGNGTGYTVENSGNTYTIKYNGTVVDTLNFVLADIADYDLNAEKDKINGMSIYSQCSDEELLAIATMYGNATDMRIDSDPEIAELYIKAFWKQYLIRVFTSSGKQKYPLESINKDVLSGSDFYYAVYFTNGLGNAYQEFENVGPIIEFEIGIS